MITLKKKIYLVAVICVIIDQLSKLVITNMLDSFTGFVVVKDFFEIMYVKNVGAAWGILSGNLIMLIFISIAALFVLLFYINKEVDINKLMMLSYGFLLGGIMGNLIDRVFRSYVVDFLHFYIFGYSYPVFNIADTLIVCGIVLMIIEVLRSEINVIKGREKRYEN